MTKNDKRTYIELLIKAIVDHDEDFSVDMHTGAVCWKMETGRTVDCTPSWAYIEDPTDLPDDGVFHITFDWVEDDRDKTVSVVFFTSYDNLESDLADYMYIIKSWRRCLK